MKGLVKSIPLYFEELLGFLMIEMILSRMVELNQTEIFSKRSLQKIWNENMAVLLENCLNIGKVNISKPDTPLLPVLTVVWYLYGGCNRHHAPVP